MNHQKKIKGTFQIILILSLSLLLTIGCKSTENDNIIPKIALYSGSGTGDGCVLATTKMFEWMDLQVTQINADSINNSSLEKFDLICFPGGNMFQYSQDISSGGMNKIRNFINNGGCYIGICGGSYFAGKQVIWQGNQLPMNSLEIFPGTTQGPVDEIAPCPDCVMCKVNIVNNSHPITQTEPDSAWIQYCYGPIFLPDENAEIDILGRYEIGDQPAIAAFEYGNGRVFIIGTHPEFEENSDRDGFPASDEMDDKGSDWELMKKAVEWCLKK